MTEATTTTTVEIEGRQLRLTNLDKVMYPATGFTKGEVIDYYRQVAEVMLPHLRDRAATLHRHPEGVGGESFFEKDVSRHAPSWLRTAHLAAASRSGGEHVNHHPVVQDLTTLVWLANLAALELHVPQWTVGSRHRKRNPDLLVFDLDPGEPATVVECCRVAERLGELLESDGYAVFAKTSGSKGLQLYCPVRSKRAEATSEYARQLAHRLAEQHPEEVVAKMTRSLRSGRVFVDWSQNNQAKTTVAPYSLRARQAPMVSTPVTWHEVRQCRRAEELAFEASDVLRRLERHGDLFADLHAEPRSVPPNS